MTEEGNSLCGAGHRVSLFCGATKGKKKSKHDTRMKQDKSFHWQQTAQLSLSKNCKQKVGSTLRINITHLPGGLMQVQRKAIRTIREMEALSREKKWREETMLV